MNMDKFLYPSHPVRCNITGPSECGKSVFLTNSILNFIMNMIKYTCTHLVFIKIYLKKNKCFSNYILINIIPNFLNEKDIDIVIEEIVNNKDFEKSDTEIETFESIEELKYPQEYENNSIINLDELNEKEMDDATVQAMFKRTRHNNLSIFIISQDCHKFGKKTIRCNGNIYHIFKPKIFRDVRNLYQDKASMDMTLNEFKYLSSSCWNRNDQPLTIDMTKDNFTGRYRLGLNGIFVPDISPFQNIDTYNYN